VTQLTSTSEERMQRELLISASINDTIVKYAQNTREAGLDGVVCSPLEAGMVKAACGKEFLTVTPGVRFADGDVGDQKRVTTPAKAKELGSDYIVVGNYEGTVRTIEILYTKLTTVDNKVVMLPNGTLSNSNIVNVGAEDFRRLDIEMSIGYSSDLKLAKTLLNTIVNNNPAVIKDRDIKVIVKSLDESCVTLETRVWVKTEDYWDTRFTLLEEYKAEFDKNGIEIPFNQMDVHIINQ
jgi:hypothetical protein